MGGKDDLGTSKIESLSKSSVGVGVRMVVFGKDGINRSVATGRVTYVEVELYVWTKLEGNLLLRRVMVI